MHIPQKQSTVPLGTDHFIRPASKSQVSPIGVKTPRFLCKCLLRRVLEDLKAGSVI